MNIILYMKTVLKERKPLDFHSGEQTVIIKFPKMMLFNENTYKLQLYYIEMFQIWLLF